MSGGAWGVHACGGVCEDSSEWDPFQRPMDVCAGGACGKGCGSVVFVGV